jgi:hypothetical protein
MLNAVHTHEGLCFMRMCVGNILQRHRALLFPFIRPSSQPLDKQMKFLLNWSSRFYSAEPLHKDRGAKGNKKGPYVAAGCS